MAKTVLPRESIQCQDRPFLAVIPILAMNFHVQDESRFSGNDIQRIIAELAQYSEVK